MELSCSSPDQGRICAGTGAGDTAMDTIQATNEAEAVFLLDLAQNPQTLHVTVDDASWAGTRE